MSFDELFYVVSRIKTVSELPLSVDLEAGYGATTSHIIDNIRRLAHLGVSGINLEDSHVVNNTLRLDDVHHVPLPLNVMCMPELADFSTLSTLGVKRISMGNFIYAATQARLKDLLCQVQTQHSFSGVF
jgi:2-methylisocitrate lyase-like PEP mutase family enzyme